MSPLEGQESPHKKGIQHPLEYSPVEGGRTGGGSRGGDGGMGNGYWQEIVIAKDENDSNNGRRPHAFFKKLEKKFLIIRGK